MPTKKLTDKEKIDRVKGQILKALTQIRDNSNRAEVLGSVTSIMAYSFAILDADKDDELGVVFVSVKIMDEINPNKRSVKILPDNERQYPLIPPEENHEPTSKNPTKK